MNTSYKHESLLYEKLGEKKVQCLTCEHQCLIQQGKIGRCNTRINEEGILYTLNYGLVSSYSINPIEKKPLFHYHPGTYAATLGSLSCNFSCLWCQNWEISKTNPFETATTSFLSPNEVERRIIKNSAITGVSFSFNEPTLSLEYALDIFNLLDDNIYKMLVTNGYMTIKALDLLIKGGLTGVSVTIKGDESMVKKYCKANVSKVWEKIEYLVEKGIHVEIICLIIPTLNDNIAFYQEVSTKILTIDKKIPLHFTRFFPSYKFTQVEATPISTLEKAHGTAKRIGLEYVYLGNVNGHTLENTYCPKCQELLIQRTGYRLKMYLDLKKAQCPKCGLMIPLQT